MRYTSEVSELNLGSELLDQFCFKPRNPFDLRLCLVRAKFYNEEQGYNNVSDFQYLVKKQGQINGYPSRVLVGSGSREKG